MKGLEFSQRVNATTEIGGVLQNATVFIGSISCSFDAFTAHYYCNVTAAGDEVANDVNVTLDGYVQALATSLNRTSNASAQQTNVINASYAHKVYPTHELGGNLTNATAKFIGGGSCNASGTFYYCSLGIAADAASNDLNVTLDGYVESLATSTGRAFHNDSQVQDNLTNVRFAVKTVLQREVDSGVISTTTLLV